MRNVGSLQGTDVDEIAAKGCTERSQSAEEEGRCSDRQVSSDLEENYRGLIVHCFIFCVVE